MLLPSGKTVYSSTPIYPGSNFTWGEATKNCTRQLEDLVIKGKLQITALEIEQKIISTAQKMDQYRAKLGDYPITVTSWYRPKKVNLAVRGGVYSRHQYGDGVDWVSHRFKPNKIATILEANHNQGGYKAYLSFTHTDWRGFKTRW